MSWGTCQGVITNSMCLGEWFHTGPNKPEFVKYNNYIIVVYDGNNYTFATMNEITGTSFKIKWGNVSAGAVHYQYQVYG